MEPSKGSAPSGNAANNDSDSEDDYMKMTFADIPVPPETSIQRVKRQRREAEARGRIKSKAELAALATAAREEALSKSLLDTAHAKKSKGFAMMAKMGFKGGALGSKDNTTAQAEPIGINVKDGREGLGLENERKRKVREAAEQAGESVKKAKVDFNEFRERTLREAKEGRLKAQLLNAQKVAERMDEEKLAEADTSPSGGGGTAADGGKTRNKIHSRPIKSLPVFYRTLVLAREQNDRLSRMRRELEQSNTSRLPGYVDEDEDADYKRALGRSGSPPPASTTIMADDLDEEDEELEEFEALEVEEKLRKVVVYLREEHRYCFWCKCAFPDEGMEGCPGIEEEDHD